MKKVNIIVLVAFTFISLGAIAQTKTTEEIKLKTTITKDGVTTKVDTSFSSMTDLETYMKASGMELPEMIGRDKHMEKGTSKHIRRIVRKEVESTNKDGYSKEVRIEKRVIRKSSNGGEISEDIDVTMDGDNIVIKDKISGEELERFKIEEGESSNIQIVIIERKLEVIDLAPEERNKFGVLKETASFTIAPNPAQSTLRVVLDGNLEDEVKLNIQAMDGRVLLEEVYSGATKSLSVDIQDLVPGTYVIRIDQAGTSSAKKLIISE
ncbi:MAG: hypothetical protein COA58_15175 [Bacteroidetes bacterium]|nr:MAG: hypothetical protein COA58_15175 [Bacteroidota bacterium]